MGETVSVHEAEEPKIRRVGSVQSEDIYTKKPPEDIKPETNSIVGRQQWRTDGDSPTVTTTVPVPQNASTKGGKPREYLPPDDGYRWRKYGRKSVKGSAFPRSYYKCTHPGCNVKKQVETVINDGRFAVHTTYKGEHSHDPPQVTHLNAKDQLSFKNSVLSEFLGQTTPKSPEVHSIPIPKPPRVTVPPPPVKTTSKRSTGMSPRLVVETSANIDYLDDGYNWRKYGQKNVKGSPHPRSYYKCTEKDCPVKKQVEQRGDKIVNTYEGTHTHLAPSLDNDSTRGGPRKRRRRKKKPDSGESNESKLVQSSPTLIVQAAIEAVEDKTSHNWKDVQPTLPIKTEIKECQQTNLETLQRFSLSKEVPTGTIVKTKEGTTFTISPPDSKLSIEGTEEDINSGGDKMKELTNVVQTSDVGGIME